LEYVFISHLHGDHIFGLPGLLSSRSNYGSEDLLTIVGPKGIRTFVEQAFALSETHLRYPIAYIEWTEDVDSEVIIDDAWCTVERISLEHRIASSGYRIVEKDRPGELLVEALKEAGVEAGPVYAKVKRGETITLANGRTICGADYVGPAIAGRVIAIAGDTRVCDGSRRLLAGADVAVHEATFADAFAHLADDYYHSTARGVAQLAAAVGVRQLVLTHISARFAGDGLLPLVEQAQAEHDNVVVAHDHFALQIPTKKAP
jgi:ribonuclease Z